MANQEGANDSPFPISPEGFEAFDREFQFLKKQFPRDCQHVCPVFAAYNAEAIQTAEVFCQEAISVQEKGACERSTAMLDKMRQHLRAAKAIDCGNIVKDGKICLAVSSNPTFGD